MKQAITCVALIALATLQAPSLYAQAPTSPSDADIRQILADRIDRDRQIVVIVVGVIDAGGRMLGACQLAPNFVLTVAREANRLFVQATGQPRFELFAEAPKEYFLKVVDARLSFVTNTAGQATAVILHQNGANLTGQRIN